MRRSSILGLLAAATLACLPAATAHAQPVTATTLATGRYVLVLRPTSLNHAAVASSNELVVPMAVAVRGNTIALGGKRGPQLVGSISNGHVVASRSGSRTLGQMNIDGTMDGVNAMSGTFSMTTPKGNVVTGSFVASPFGVGWGSGVLGTPKGPTGGAVPSGGSSGHVTAPGGGAANLPSASGTLGAVHGGRGPTVSWRNGSAVLEPGGGSAPGQAGQGPNLTTTSVGGAASEDPKDVDAAASSGTNSVSDAVGDLDYLNPKGSADGGSTKPATAPKQGDGSQAQSGTSLWDTLFGTTNNNPSPITPVKPPKHGSGGSVDDRQTYGGNDRLNRGAGGRGGNDGSGSTDRGSSGSGGQNAQGQHLAVHPNGGDNPFEVAGDDVLDTQHLVNPASDPIFGPAMRH